jgi:membrane protein YqaA with SNARE-associated domain
MLALIGLFLAAFLAATLIPAQSEAVLVGLLLAGVHPVGLLVAIASLGNVLGAVVNWSVGRFVIRWAGHPRFPVSPAMLDRAQGWYHRWGWISLLGSWLPVVGDPLTVVAGAMREPLWRFLLVVGLAKTGRYGALAAVTLGIAEAGSTR